MKSKVICKTQCTAPTGETGSFLIDVNRNQLISPVCRDLVDLFAWCRVNGWIEDPAWAGNPYMPEYVKV